MTGSRDIPGLVVVRLGSEGDGIAYVGRVLERFLVDRYGVAPRVVELAPGSADGTTPAERIRFLIRMLAEQVRRRADLWFFNHLALARVQAMIPGPLRAPHVVFLHGIEAWRPAWRRGETSGVAFARGRIAFSAHTARTTVRHHPEIGHVHVCPLCLLPPEPEDEKPPDRWASSLVDEWTVLVVGRMSASERYKGHDALLDSWDRVRHRIPRARLAFVGRGDDVDRLRAKAIELGHADSVSFLGFLSSAALEEAWRRAALFALPSRQEGFGLVYLEAMRAGLPCVASRCDAGGEVVLDGVTGFLVDPDRPEELSESLIRLLEDPDLRQRMGEAGRARFGERFTYEAFQRRLGDILEELGL